MLLEFGHGDNKVRRDREAGEKDERHRGIEQDSCSVKVLLKVELTRVGQWGHGRRAR